MRSRDILIFSNNALKAIFSLFKKKRFLVSSPGTLLSINHRNLCLTTANQTKEKGGEKIILTKLFRNHLLCRPKGGS